MAFTLTSDAFGDGETIPRRHTCEGEDASPSLSWTGAPAGTEGFALLMDDPDAPTGTFTHWLVYDIPRDAEGLEEGVPPGQAGRMLVNDFGRAGYGGPCPPKGHGTHHYGFTLFALDVPVVRLRGDTRADFDEAIRSHVLASVTLTGVYARQ